MHLAPGDTLSRNVPNEERCLAFLIGLPVRAKMMPASVCGIYREIDIKLNGAIVTATAKLFTHGRSQAVRLPREFRFEGTEVRVSRVGDKVILEPMKRDPMPWALIDELGDNPFMPEGREQPEMPADRLVFER